MVESSYETCPFCLNHERFNKQPWACLDVVFLFEKVRYLIKFPIPPILDVIFLFGKVRYLIKLTQFNSGVFGCHLYNRQKTTIYTSFGCRI